MRQSSIDEEEMTIKTLTNIPMPSDAHFEYNHSLILASAANS